MTHNHPVVGSSPTQPTKKFYGVEHENPLRMFHPIFLYPILVVGWVNYPVLS